MLKASNLITLALIFTANSLFSQLIGTAFLGAQSNHSGIKVKFKANPGTAVTDSTLTDAAGNYSINITGGIYNVSFSKTGYQPLYYNTNQPIILTNTTVLNSVTLSAGNVVPVSGTVSGTWVNTNIYVVNGDITIPTGNTLIIDPGTVVKFNGSYTLTANGVLKAIGTAANGILFTSNLIPANAQDWKGVYINNGLSKMQYCKVEYADIGIKIYNCSPNISNNTIVRFYYIGIDLQNSSSHITDNEIYDFNTVTFSQGIHLYGAKALIECNSIHDGGGSGVRSQGSGIIRNNVIHHINGGSFSNGVRCEAFDTSLVINNIIHDCGMGILIGDNVGPSPKPRLVNNTIFSNIRGIYCDGFYANPKIINNIITSNSADGIVQTYSPSISTPLEVSNNNVWNNAVSDYKDIQILGLGQMVSTNSNGDPVDSYFNISKDPLFSGGQPPYLSATSPCINAGKVLYSSTIGANTNSFCAEMEIGLREDKKETAFNVFPSPFLDNITVNSFNMDMRESSVKLYDIIGRLVNVTVNLVSEGELKIEASNLTSGIYFLQIVSDNSKQTIKLIKN